MDNDTLELIVYFILGSIVVLVVPSCGIPSSVKLFISYLTIEFFVLVYEIKNSTSFFNETPNNGTSNPAFEKLAVNPISLERVSFIFEVLALKSYVVLEENLILPLRFPPHN